MEIAVGADPYGTKLLQAVKAHLQQAGHAVHDVGGDRPYYEIARDVARRVGGGQAERGVLVCGTGMGMAIIANKFPGVYAAVCENPEAAEKSRSINDANVLTLGELVTRPQAAAAIVDRWLATEFTQGWEPSVQEWLRNASHDITRLEAETFGKPVVD
jgi:ribose 5-phosphate isomerase B